MLKKFIAVILFALTILLVVPLSSAFAYTGGILEGNLMYNGKSGDTTSQTNGTKNMTDGNLSTSSTLSYSGGYNTSWALITVSTIDSYQLKMNYLSVPTNAIYLKFYDISDNELYSTNVLNGSGVKVNIAPVPNVKKVVLINTNASNGAYIYEFDIFVAAATLPPTVPLRLSAVGGNAKVDLNWTSVQGATSYNIKRSTIAGGPYTNIGLNVAMTTYTDTTVTNGTKYYYILTAVNDGGESANSQEVSATPQVPPPSAPTNLTATTVNNQVYLTWDSVTNATYYVLERSTNAGGPYSSIYNSVTSTTYTDLNLTNGTYYYVVHAVNSGGVSGNSNEASATIQLDPQLKITIAEEKVKVGQEVIANVSLKNVSNIYAEDFSVGFDKNLFDYVGFEQVPGYKVYNTPVANQNGVVRFIVSSQGQQYGITGEKTFVKLKLKAKAPGTGKVDALKCRIADIDKEFDLTEQSCGEDSVVIEGFQDVNKSGEYTLVDLAIDAYYYGQLASNADPVKYNVNQAGDEYVADDDLVFIVNQMLANANYASNK
ncbi:fibronectin type III domain-containing protein [Paenibacillus alba]|uniref:Cohesin domain-containing protein n=1 Tax=Paenibacillus alba TaxID=1197127 RepID=A0ABU6G556_9BACL|nr:hypothetical protein [Paenibacillus alba]MEC0229308.1 cohesin domain-containing protein [Paenibacillus alba]